MGTKHILYEGVLNDDYLTIGKDGLVVITYFTYATEWSNHEHHKTCFDLPRALRWYMDNFPDRADESDLINLIEE